MREVTLFNCIQPPKQCAQRPKCMKLSTGDADFTVFAKHKGRIIIYTTRTLQPAKHFLISKKHNIHASTTALFTLISPTWSDFFFFYFLFVFRKLHLSYSQHIFSSFLLTSSQDKFSNLLRQTWLNLKQKRGLPVTQFSQTSCEQLRKH